MEQMKKLTDKQRKVVEDNFAIVIHTVNKYGMRENDMSDWYGIAAEGLCIAAQKYDQGKKEGSFFNFAEAIITNMFKNEFRKNKNYKKAKELYFESQTEERAFCEIPKIIEEKDLMERCMDGMNSQTKEILTMVAKGYSTTDIINTLGVTLSKIHNAKLRLRRKVKRENEKMVSGRGCAFED